MVDEKTDRERVRETGRERENKRRSKEEYVILWMIIEKNRGKILFTLKKLITYLTFTISTRIFNYGNLLIICIGFTEIHASR